MSYIDSKIKFTPPYPRTSPAFKLIWAQFVITASDVDIKDFGATLQNFAILVREKIYKVYLVVGRHWYQKNL